MPVSGIVISMGVGDIITGKESGVIATIDSISNNNGRYIVDYSAKKDIGWSDNIGKLNDDTQVIPNNDYYQRALRPCSYVHK